MRRLLLMSAGVLIALCSHAQQSFNIVQGNVTYNFPVTSDIMEFQGGTTVNIQGVVFNLSEISTMEVGENLIDNNTVMVEYADENAYVTVAGNVAQYVAAEVEGAYVTITQSDEVSDETCGEITYILKGTSPNGCFVQNGSFKSTIELQGLDLTNLSGAAIDIENGKRIEFSVKKDTENSLIDSKDGKQKAALYCKGHLELKGKGILNVTGNTAHAISAKEYIELKNCTINIISSEKDGLNCNQYFLMESGELNISNPGDDGIQVSYKDETDRESEDTGTFTITDGTININAITAAAAKGIKADNSLVITGGNISIVSNAPGEWDATKEKTKASACLNADGDIDISGGTHTLSASGAGGKCISCDGTFHSSGGTVIGSTTGGALVYRNGTLYQGNYGSNNLDNIASDYKSSPKAIKADTEAILEGGNFDLSTTGTNGEGIESKGDLTFDGDVVVKVRAYDDATNSSNNTYIKGGTLDLGSTGQGDGVDSNANIYISGGHTTVFSSQVGSEQGLDSGDGNYGTYITGGAILSYGSAGNGRISATSNSQAFVTVSSTLTAGMEVVVKDSEGTTTLGEFTIPADFRAGTSSGGGGRPGGSGNSSDKVLISVPGMQSGSSYSVTAGATTTKATAQTSGGSSGPGGFGPGGGR